MIFVLDKVRRKCSTYAALQCVIGNYHGKMLKKRGSGEYARPGVQMRE